MGRGLPNRRHAILEFAAEGQLFDRLLSDQPVKGKKNGRQGGAPKVKRNMRNSQLR
jgi:hypothetical protein